jgi:hypothetical protein
MLPDELRWRRLRIQIRAASQTCGAKLRLT